MSDGPTPRTLPDDPELAELRGHLRGQWKTQRRAEEREAVREHWLQRDLIDAVTEAMHRGDHVTFTLPGDRTLSGHIVATGRDYALLREPREPFREFGVRLTDPDRRQAGDPYAGPSVLVEIQASDASTAATSDAANAPPTFQALLHQYDSEQQAHPGRELELGTIFHPQGLVCRLRAHAWDHLYIENSSRHSFLIPTGRVTYIGWSLPEQLR